MFKGKPIYDPMNYVPFYATEIMARPMLHGVVDIAFLVDRANEWLVVNRVIRPAASLLANGKIVVKVAGGYGVEEEILYAVEATGTH